MDEKITIPVEATYRIVNGEAVQINAKYAEISTGAFAQFLLERFNVPVSGAVSK